MKRLATTLAGAMALMAAATATARAQVPVTSEPTMVRSNTRGVHFGVQLTGSAHKFDDSDVTESGAGGGLRLGYGFTERMTFFVQADAANVESADASGTYTLVHLDLGGRYTFLNAQSRLRPYLAAAMSGRAASSSINGSDVTLSGSAFTAGGGLQYFASRSAAVDFGLQLSNGTFNRVTVDGQSETVDGVGASTSSRFTVGLSFYPGGR